ncbi:MAG: hypothetical protein A3K09_02910 [Nitrospinae bacterium RIFCSPLOWO2_12_FULL_47_7]|nr:MAG: hypothetical protein A3K09_02910 [Nitrospinae bacterium RIFCSPLOWO2_12_FULL_47_7]
MGSLKEILFIQYAGEGLSCLIEEMQTKHKPKKGRRFNYNNITYEVGRPTVKDNAIEIEISSKIPQDDVQNPKDLKTYFNEVKKKLSHEKKPADVIEMENIVWDSKKDSEKEREYIKLTYHYPLNELYSEKEIDTLEKAITSGSSKEAIPDIPSVVTLRGKLVLLKIRENIQDIVREHLDNLMSANKAVYEKVTA